jgi:hypothetical protein
MTMESIFARIDSDDETAANACTALVRYMADRPAGAAGWEVALLAALAMQITGHRLLRAHGLDVPLLAGDQLILLRVLLRHFGPELAAIAERRACRGQAGRPPSANGGK